MKHADLCEAVLQRAGGLTGGVSGEADFLALFEGPSRDSVQVTVADTTAETEGRRIIMSDMHTETGSTESERVSHTPALSTPGAVGRDDHFSAVVRVCVVDVEFQAFALMGFYQ